MEVVEHVLAYGNARSPPAMLQVGSACSDQSLVSADLEAQIVLLSGQGGLGWLFLGEGCLPGFVAGLGGYVAQAELYADLP
jgi:hypothetical protein